jgi:hypothetical protein
LVSIKKIPPSTREKYKKVFTGSIKVRAIKNAVAYKKNAAVEFEHLPPLHRKGIIANPNKDIGDCHGK